ncbi:trace amine-associated receptor 1-like [Cyprinodon tularosa]|uniref:trace amine-associated receptor 1-like n=1 Tax=Cyprinodon tularosa TaxID=77115 RepID=UPI0018E28B61|nr:trace amine-associated receptor 1-like [Cyprinodon tularosa]
MHFLWVIVFILMDFRSNLYVPMENRTNVLIYLLHPCFEMNLFSYKLTTPSAVCVIVQVFLTLLSLVTVCGNLLVIISIFYFKQLHTPTNTLIQSLAVADLLVGVLAFPLTMSFSFTSCFYDNNMFCKIKNSFDVLLSTCSILHMCCISVDRYYAVCQPLTYRSKISLHVVIIMIVISWGLSVLTAIGVIISRLNTEECLDACFIDIIMTNIVGPLTSFYLPVVIMLCIYLKIFVVAQRQARSIQTKKNSGATVSKMERKATKTLAIVLGAFLFCWAPFFLSFTLAPFSNSFVMVSVIESTSWFALINSTLNPFIYAFFYSWFRSAFKIIVSGKIFVGNYGNLKLN